MKFCVEKLLLIFVWIVQDKFDEAAWRGDESKNGDEKVAASLQGENNEVKETKFNLLGDQNLMINYVS